MDFDKVTQGSLILLAGAAIKALWDSFQAGRVKRVPVYVTTKEFTAALKERDEHCPGLAAYRNKTDTKLSKYVTTKEFTAALKERDEHCPGLAAYRDKTDTKLSNMDKRLDKGAEDFGKIREDIGEIKIVLAGMKVLLETKIESITIKPKDGN